MKKLLVLFIAIVIGFGLLIKSNSDKAVENKRKEKIEELKKSGLSHTTAEKLLTVKSKVKRQQVTDIVKTLSEWTDAMQLASSTSRIALAQPISNMQEIKRNLSTKKYSDDCGNILQSQALEYMGYSIDSFLYFLRDDDYEADKSLEKAADSRKDVQAIIHFCEMEF